MFGWKSLTPLVIAIPVICSPNSHATCGLPMLTWELELVEVGPRASDDGPNATPAVEWPEAGLLNEFQGQNFIWYNINLYPAFSHTVPEITLYTKFTRPGELW